MKKKETIGTETIYRYLLRDKCHGGTLWKNLRHARSRRKKRYGYHRWPTQIPRNAAADRPQIIDERKRNGDFERDLIVGAARSGYLLTLVDRRSKLVKLVGLQNNKAELIHVETVKHLENLNAKSITNDNGCEFAYHIKTAKELKIPIYFTRPYASWERGTVENTNKLIRQYFPKKTNLKELSYEKIKMVETLLNARPRKQLGYRTPIECAS
jgi:IS30 family transposase